MTQKIRIHNHLELKERIAFLETQKGEQEIALKKAFKELHDSLKPSNFIKNIIQNAYKDQQTRSGLLDAGIHYLVKFIIERIIHKSKVKEYLNVITQRFFTENISSQYQTKFKDIFEAIFQTDNKHQKPEETDKK